jgi:hypothetical protein
MLIEKKVSGACRSETRDTEVVDRGQRVRGRVDQVRVRVRGDTFESFKSFASKNTLMGNATANRQAPAVAQLYAAHLVPRPVISTTQGQDRWRERHTTRYNSHH